MKDLSKEEIDLLDRFANVALGVCLSEFNLASGMSKEDVDVMCKGCYSIAKEMLVARKEALKNGLKIGVKYE